MSKNIKFTARHVEYSYILAFANLLGTDKETKSVKRVKSGKPIYHHVN